MNVNREIKSAGFDNLKELTTELKNNGKLIEELPYPLRFNPEVILASLTNYLQATEYIDNVFVSENFLTRVFVINIEAFIKIVKHPISEDLFKQIISNIAYIDNLKYDAKLQDKLYEVFAMLPTEYIIKYKSLLCKSDFFIYYSAKEYLSRFAKSKDDVVEKILAFESALKERNLSNMEKLSLLLANYIPKFGIEYYEVFAKYINLNYSVDDIITLYKKPYFIRTSSEFIFFYINTLTSFYDILIFLYGLFDYSSIIEYYFNNDEAKILKYFSNLLVKISTSQPFFADKLFIFLVKNTNIDLFKLVKMFKDYVHGPESHNHCKALFESYNYLLNTSTNKKEREFLESLKE